MTAKSIFDEIRARGETDFDASSANVLFKINDAMAFDYTKYKIAGLPLVGTAIRFPNLQEAQTAYLATGPAFSVEFNNCTYLVYNDVYISIDEWVAEFEKRWDGDVAKAENIVRTLFCQIKEKVRDNGQPFADLEASFGINEYNQVKFVRGPTGSDFHANIAHLENISTKLRDSLKKLFPDAEKNTTGKSIFDEIRARGETDFDASYANVLFKINDAMAFDYTKHKIAGLPVVGTAIRFPNLQAAQTAYLATGPASSVEFNNCTYLVYNDVYISIDEWVAEFEKRWDGDVAKAENIVRTLFCQITEEVRDNDQPFADLEASFGINEYNQVKFVRGPTGSDFHANIAHLENISTKLRDSLKKLFPDAEKNTTVKELECFKGFINDYHNWKQQNFEEENLQMLVLNHPSTLDEILTVRLFNNLGKMCDADRTSNLCLSSNSEFEQHISGTIPDWVNDVKKDKYLESVYNHAKKKKKQGYRIGDIPRYCLNAMKHYGQNGGPNLVKIQIIHILCERVDGLAHHMYTAYAKALVYGGYVHPDFPPAISFGME